MIWFCVTIMAYSLTSTIGKKALCASRFTTPTRISFADGALASDTSCTRTPRSDKRFSTASLPVLP